MKIYQKHTFKDIDRLIGSMLEKLNRGYVQISGKIDIHGSKEEKNDRFLGHYVFLNLAFLQIMYFILKIAKMIIENSKLLLKINL
jgi:hypothetical protein